MYKTKTTTAPDPYDVLYRELRDALGGLPTMSVTQVTNQSKKYVVMGRHFEVLMKAINSHESLQFEWENLMVLLRMSGSDGNADE